MLAVHLDGADKSVPWDVEITVQPGEARDLGTIELHRLPVHFQVNAQMPRDCTFEVRGANGRVRYDTVQQVPQFDVPEPAPSDEVVFDCPTLGVRVYPIGPTEPGATVIIPTLAP